MGFIFRSAAMLFLLSGSPAPAAETATVFPVLTDEPLYGNPYMGWAHLEKALPGLIDAGRREDELDDGTAWEKYNAVKLLSNWRTLNPSEDVYDWDLLDEAFDYWEGIGKEIILHVATDAQLVNSTDYPIPQWLMDKGVHTMVRTNSGKVFTCADLSDPVYQAELETFLDALAGRYAIRPGLAAVNLQGYGLWGEWHSGHDFADVADRRSTLNEIIELWTDAFTSAGYDGLFHISTSHEFRTDMIPPVTTSGTNVISYQDYVLNSAFENHLYNPLIAGHRSGYGRAIWEDMDGRLQHQIWFQTRKPFIGELSQPFGSTVYGYDDSAMLDEPMLYHVNYMTRGGDNVDFYNDEEDLLDEGQKEMGYRLGVVRADYPSAVFPGDNLPMSITWVNLANGRLPQSYRMRLYFMQGDDVKWIRTDSLFDPTDIVRGSEYQWSYNWFSVPSTASNGVYDVRVALIDSSGAPVVRLAMADGNELRYKIGTLTVTNGIADSEDLPIETFEMNSMSLTDYTLAANGSLTSNSEEVARGQVSVCGNVSTSTEWAVFMNSDSGLLESNASYRVSFEAKPVVRAGGYLTEPGFFQFFARSGSGGVSEDRGTFRWGDEPGGGSVAKTVYFTLGGFSDYKLYWGMHWGGSYSVDSILVQEIAASNIVHHADFESGTLSGSGYWCPYGNGSITNHAVKGDYSIQGGPIAYDPSTLTPQTSEFLRSSFSPVPLKSNTTYTVSFSFVQDERESYGSYYYFYARSAAAGASSDVGYTRWNDNAGDLKQKVVTFTTGAYSDYQLRWGMKRGGSCRIDEILVVEH